MSQRAVEMSEEADILSISQFQLAPAVLQGQTKAKMVIMVSVLQDLIGQLTSIRMQHLFMILASPRSGFPLDFGLFWDMMQSSAALSSPDPLGLIPASHNSVVPARDKGSLWGKMEWCDESASWVGQGNWMWYPSQKGIEGCGG